MSFDILNRLSRINQNTSRKLKKTVRKKLDLLYFASQCFTKSNHKKTIVFISGSFRSGKTTLLNIIGRCPECCVYHETNDLAYKKNRIRPYDRISSLIKKNYKKIIVFELVNDLQYTDRFLSLHPNAKAIWIYRNYHDVVNLMIERWGTVQKKIMLGISKGTYSSQGVRDIRERMKPETLELLDEVCNEEMSYEDGAALVWYVRNLMYFDLRLHKDHRVLLVNNDDVFINPMQHLKRIFGFISCPFDKDYANDILTLSTRKIPSSIIDPRIEHLCQEMMYRLNEQYKLKMDNLY